VALPLLGWPILLATLALAPDPITPTVPHMVATRTWKAPLVDGRLDDEAWRAAPGTEGFTQYYPFDGAKPSERTLLRVLYDDEAVYVAFDCEQVNTPIVERLTRRDRDSESEWVWIQVDSRNDGKSAFMFAVNISGSMADSQIIDQTNYFWEWDENWEAKTATNQAGWSAEIRIPLRSLRFDSSLPVQSWGFQATRFIAERQETNMWAYFPRDVSNPVTYLGRLDDLRDLKGGGPLELRPFVTGFGRRRDAAPDTLGSGLSLGGSLGLDLKWHATQDLTLDAAINPDFAQVEADQVILNLTNFETLLPEKRPFFLEGMDAFSFPLQVFYSRRIGGPPLAPTLGTGVLGQATQRLVDVPEPVTIYGAGKMVGRIGTRWTLGALSALTAANNVTVVDQNGVRMPQLLAPTTAYNVLRLKRDLGGASHVGLIGTGASGFNANDRFRDAYVGGVDGRWRSANAEYIAAGALIQSYLQGGPAPTPEADGTLIGPGAKGLGAWARVAKEGGKPLLWSAEYSGAGSQLQYNAVGYMARQNLHATKLSVGLRTLAPGAYTVETTSAFEFSDNRNLAGLDLGQLYEVNTRLRLKNFSSIFLAANIAPARFDDREIGDGTALERARYTGGRFELASDPRGRLYATLASQLSVIGAGTYATSAQASLVWHALPQLDIEFLPQVTWAEGEYRLARPVTTATDHFFGKLKANSVSATLRTIYTFTPQLTLQAYAQAFLASGHFDDLRAVAPMAGDRVTLSELNAAAPVDPATLSGTPDFQDAALNVNVVFRWEYMLGSTLFLVYAHSQIPTVTNFMAPARLDPGAFGHGASSDVVLLKFSYWWAG
jgi:hypothetical protein